MERLRRRTAVGEPQYARPARRRSRGRTLHRTARPEFFFGVPGPRALGDATTGQVEHLRARQRADARGRARRLLLRHPAGQGERQPQRQEAGHLALGRDPGRDDLPASGQRRAQRHRGRRLRRAGAGDPQRGATPWPRGIAGQFRQGLHQAAGESADRHYGAGRQLGHPGRRCKRGAASSRAGRSYTKRQLFTAR